MMVGSIGEGGMMDRETKSLERGGEEDGTGGMVAGKLSFKVGTGESTRVRGTESTTPEVLWSVTGGARMS